MNCAKLWRDEKTQYARLSPEGLDEKPVETREETKFGKASGECAVDDRPIQSEFAPFRDFGDTLGLFQFRIIAMSYDLANVHCEMGHSDPIILCDHAAQCLHIVSKLVQTSRTKFSDAPESGAPGPLQSRYGAVADPPVSDAGHVRLPGPEHQLDVEHSRKW